MGKLSVAEAEGQLSKLIDSALTGEEVTITRDGVAVVTLQPVPREAPEAERALPTLEEREAMMEWLERHRVEPEQVIDSAALLSRMRDEDYERF